MKFTASPWKSLTILAVVLAWQNLTSASFAADATITVGTGGAFVFTPSTVNINVGDKVIWNWSGSFHSTTSGTVSGSTETPDGLWDSGINNVPHSFTNTFNSAGSFPYYCIPHASLGMTGSVTVAGVNLAPTVSITSPTNGTVFSEPANVTISATASDSDGSIASVQFLVGAGVVATQTTTPFSTITNNLSAGNYILSAIATDNGGLKATNSVNISVVTAVPVIVSSSQWLPPANFQFNYSANVGLRYVVQRSTNLTSPVWMDIVTNMAGNNPESFTDTNAAADASFYRISRLPNP